MMITLREKCPYSELFWSAFSRIQTEYRENADLNNCEYGHVLHSVSNTVVSKLRKTSHFLGLWSYFCFQFFQYT